jgi:predicted enzyme related to lactoylglutathione lyase
MSSSAVLGQFLWHELLTTDSAAGAGFYSKVFGWNARPWEGDADYTMLAHANGPVGGARVVGKDPLADKVGLNWLTYVGVPDLTAALAAVEAKGGRVIHPVTGLSSDGGRYAVITDPQGATIGLYEPGASMSSGNAGPMSGPVAWHELTAEDPEAALQFYKAIVGWDVLGTHDMGGDVGTYYLFGIGTTQMGGAFKRSRDSASTRPRWLIYVHVPGVTAAVAAVLAAGGKLLNGPHQVPGGNWVAQVVDSHGVHLAMHGPKDLPASAPKPRAKPKAKAAAKPKVEVKPAVAEKPKAKVKTKVKTKKKAKSQAKRKAAPKRKVASKPKVKAQTKSKSKSKTKTKTKTKTKMKAKGKAQAKGRSKARKAPRRAK